MTMCDRFMITCDCCGEDRYRLPWRYACLPHVVFDAMCDDCAASLRADLPYIWDAAHPLRPFPGVRDDGSAGNGRTDSVFLERVRLTRRDDVYEARALLVLHELDHGPILPSAAPAAEVGWPCLGRMLDAVYPGGESGFVREREPRPAGYRVPFYS